MKVLAYFACCSLPRSLASAQMYSYSKIDESVAVDNGVTALLDGDHV